jgi:hypothetical protein
MFFRVNGEASPVGSQRRMPRSRFAAFSRKGRILFPSGHTRKAGDGASRLSRCTRRPPSRPWATHPFTSTWPSPTPCETVALVNEKLPRQSFAVGYEKLVHDSNLKQLITAARLLPPLLGELVFVGGTVTGLLITDEAAADPRTTLDVDAIAEITSYPAYAKFGDRLRALGFLEDSREGAPLCRWVHHETILDVMPLDERILGFSNRWYRAALKSSVTQRLANDLAIRIVTGPLFIATKLEEFKGRGKADFFGSRDLEDLIAVVDGRAALVTEVRAGAAEFRAFVRTEIKRLLATPRFLDALPGHLLPDEASQSRISIVLGRLEGLASV